MTNPEANQEASPSGSGSSSNLVTVTTSVPNIEELEGQANYGSWKFAMKMSLMLEGLYGNVENAVPLITPTEAEKDKRALAKICLSIKQNCYVHVCNATTAKEAWDNLKNAFEGRNLATVFEMTRKLFNVRQDHHSSMEEYITDVLVQYKSCLIWEKLWRINGLLSL